MWKPMLQQSEPEGALALSEVKLRFLLLMIRLRLRETLILCWQKQGLSLFMIYMSQEQGMSLFLMLMRLQRGSICV